MKDEKEKIIDNALEKYGPNKYSQFMAWQEIAHRTSDENSRIKSLGHHIASCILGGQYGS